MEENLRQMRGRQNYLAGQSGEQSVLREYQDLGYRVVAQRWRGGGGELDFVFEGQEGLVFVEVKTARTHDLAAARVSQAQIYRIFKAATIFADHYAPETLIDMRFDVALVDSVGAVQILENAMMST